MAIIDKLHTQIGNVNRLHNIIEPFAVLFWALGIVLAHILKQLTQPAGPASLKYGRGIDKLYTQIGNVNRLHNIIEPFAALF